MLDLDRIFAYLANCRWFRRVRANGRLDLGGYDYYLGITWRNQMLEVHFDFDQECFLVQPAGSDITITFAPQGLTKSDLMGELGHLLNLPAYQLACHLLLRRGASLSILASWLVRLSETCTENGDMTYPEPTKRTHKKLIFLTSKGRSLSFEEQKP